MENSIVIKIDRPFVEHILGKLTDEQWEVLSVNLEEYMYEYAFNQATVLFKDIDNLIEEYEATYLDQ